MSASGSTPNLLSATSMSTPVSTADLAHQHWSSTTVLPMSQHQRPPMPDDDGGLGNMDSTPLSFVQPAGLSPPLPNIRRHTTNNLLDDNRVVSVDYLLLQSTRHL